MSKSVLSADHFHDEAAALAFIEARLWPHGPVCPRCGCLICYGLTSGVGPEADLKNLPATECATGVNNNLPSTRPSSTAAATPPGRCASSPARGCFPGSCPRRKPSPALIADGQVLQRGVAEIYFASPGIFAVLA